MKNLLLLAILSFVPSAFSQSRVEFEHKSWDFGKIEESAGVVSHTFNYKNNSSESLVIYTIGVSCGCTTPRWDKKPIAAGEKGEITLIFDPYGRPGKFEKYAEIESSQGSIRLIITGIVDPKPRTIIDDYPFAIADGLRIADRSVMLGLVPRAELNVSSLQIANNSDKPLQIAVVGDNHPNYFDVRAAKETLQPGERSEIRIKFDTRTADLWGTQDFVFSLIVNGKETDGFVGVRGIVVENFKSLTNQERINAPRSEYSSYFYHFSTQPVGAKLERDFKVTNSGERDLVIRYLDYDKDKIDVQVSKKTIKKGETAVVHIVLKNTDKTGMITEIVRILTNDPEQPVREIRLMARMAQVENIAN